jgi:hypothetical protein
MDYATTVATRLPKTFAALAAGLIDPFHLRTSRPRGTTPPSPGPGPGPDARPSLAAHVTLTIPLATWQGRADTPGDADGYGPLDGDDARDLAAAARHPLVPHRPEPRRHRRRPRLPARPPPPAPRQPPGHRPSRDRPAPHRHDAAADPARARHPDLARPLRPHLHHHPHPLLPVDTVASQRAVVSAGYHRDRGRDKSLGVKGAVWPMPGYAPHRAADPRLRVTGYGRGADAQLPARRRIVSNCPLCPLAW